MDVQELLDRSFRAGGLLCRGVVCTTRAAISTSAGAILTYSFRPRTRGGSRSSILDCLRLAEGRAAGSIAPIVIALRLVHFPGRNGSKILTGSGIGDDHAAAFNAPTLIDLGLTPMQWRRRFIVNHHITPKSASEQQTCRGCVVENRAEARLLMHQRGEIARRTARRSRCLSEPIRCSYSCRYSSKAGVPRLSRAESS